MSTVEEGGQEEGVGAAIGVPLIYLEAEGDGLVGTYTSCDHKVGEPDMGGTHGVGDEADMGGGGQQICIAKVTGPNG